MRKNKKGATFDNFFVLVTFLGLAFVGLTAILVFNELTDTELNEQLWDQTSVGSAVREDARTFYDNLDTIMLLAYIGAHITIIVLGFALRSHPIILLVLIILSAVLVIIAAPLANVWSDVVTTQASFVAAAATLPKINLIMSKLPLFELIWAVLTGVIIVGTSRTEEFI